MKLNKRKSEILTKLSVEEINGIKCSTTVKYLGVRVAVDKKDQIRISKEQINKNVQLLRWRLKNVDVDVLERLTCCLARSMLIYIGTPMAAAGLWKRKDIDRFEAGIYRKILGAPNNISNKTILISLQNNIIRNVVYARRLSTRRLASDRPRLQGDEGDEILLPAFYCYRRVAQLLAPLLTRATTSERDSDRPPLPLREATGSRTLYHCVDIELRDIGCSFFTDSQHSVQLRVER